MIEEFISQLEKATGPDRALADEVLIACGWVADSNDEGEVTAWYDPNGIQHGPLDLPDPTGSIDAALTLVPEWHKWSVACGKRVQYVARVAPTKSNHGCSDGECDSTPAIALCIAALRARATITAASAVPHG